MTNNHAQGNLNRASLLLCLIPITLVVLLIIFGDGDRIPAYVFIIPLVGSILGILFLYVGLSRKFSRSR